MDMLLERLQAEIEARQRRYALAEAAEAEHWVTLAGGQHVRIDAQGHMEQPGAAPDAQGPATATDTKMRGDVPDLPDGYRIRSVRMRGHGGKWGMIHMLFKDKKEIGTYPTIAKAKAGIKQHQHEQVHERVLASTQYALVEAAGRWITLHAEGSDEGTVHIFIGGGGIVTKGPASLIGSNIKHLPGKKTHHPAGHEPPGAKDHPHYREHLSPEPKTGQPYARLHGAAQTRQEQGPEPLSADEAREGLAHARAAVRSKPSREQQKLYTDLDELSKYFSGRLAPGQITHLRTLIDSGVVNGPNNLSLRAESLADLTRLDRGGHISLTAYNDIATRISADLEHFDYDAIRTDIEHLSTRPMKRHRIDDTLGQGRSGAYQYLAEHLQTAVDSGAFDDIPLSDVGRRVDIAHTIAGHREAGLLSKTAFAGIARQLVNPKRTIAQLSQAQEKAAPVVRYLGSSSSHFSTLLTDYRAARTHQGVPDRAVTVLPETQRADSEEKALSGMQRVPDATIHLVRAFGTTYHIGGMIRPTTSLAGKGIMAVGLYQPTTKTVQVFDHLGVDNTLIHETGHAVDAALGYPSHTGAFVKLYEQHKGNTRLWDYMRSHPQELFAEGYAMLHYTERSAEKLKYDAPELYTYLTGLDAALETLWKD